MVQRIFMYISALKFSENWWRLSYLEKKGIVDSIKEEERKHSEKLLIKRFTSLRHNCDVIYWLVSQETKYFQDFKYSLLESSLGNIYEVFSLLSIYKPSPYYVGKEDYALEKIERDSLKYFVAYPMKKSPEWYLLPFDERRSLIREHAEMASQLNKFGIRAYTTYSYGLIDDEFVVIYETPDLEGWSYVVEKLREARARKWILREEPILIGEKRNLEEFIKK